MAAVAIEYDYISPDRNSIYGILNNTILEFNRKYGEGYRKIECKCNIKYFDKIRNKTKNITTTGGVEKTIIASNGRYEYININKYTSIIEEGISINVINTYMKCGNIPILWIKLFLNIANNRHYVYNFCNRPLNKFDRHCREWYLYNNSDADDIRMLNDELNNYGAYW